MSHEQLIDTLGEAGLERALTVIGPSFLRNPHAALNPSFYYTADHLVKQGRRLSQATLVGQGPLPIEINGKEKQVIAAAVNIPGFEGYAGLAILPELMPESMRGGVTLNVVVEDHPSMVMQHEGRGGLWAQLDAALKKGLTEGGGLLLLPECMKPLSFSVIDSIAKGAAELFGFGKHELLIPQHKRPRFPLPLKEFQTKDLGRVHLLGAEWVELPFSKMPFMHYVYSDQHSPKDIHHAWVYGDITGDQVIPVRTHSACSSSEVMGAINCDCPDQLDATMQYIVAKGNGVLLYMGGKHEGRGHGVGAKVATWPLNIEEEVELISAFNAAGLSADARNFIVAADFLKRVLGIERIELLTNNMAVKAKQLNKLITIVGSRSVATIPRTTACERDHGAKAEQRGDLFDHNAIPTPNIIFERH